MPKSIAFQIEKARAEMIKTINTIQEECRLPPSILDGILSEILADIRSEEKIELLNAVNDCLKEGGNNEQCV